MCGCQWRDGGGGVIWHFSSKRSLRHTAAMVVQEPIKQVRLIGWRGTATALPNSEYHWVPWISSAAVLLVAFASPHSLRGDFDSDSSFFASSASNSTTFVRIISRDSTLVCCRRDIKFLSFNSSLYTTRNHASRPLHQMRGVRQGL